MSDNIFADAVDHFLETLNARDPSKYLQGRVTNGTAFAHDAQLRTQYCVGSMFVEGWIGNMKVRMYGNISYKWYIYFGHISEGIDENNQKHYASGKVLQHDTREVILAAVEENLNFFLAQVEK